MKMIPYGRQEILEEDKLAVLEALGGDFLTQGPLVEKFEQAFHGVLNSKYNIAVTNGTAALHLAAMALGVKPGDRVLITPNTFVASANCIRFCGADLEFVDIDPVNFCLDLDLLEKKLQQEKPGTYKGIICVDFAGYPVNFEKLRKIADKFSLWIIEDACHALGAQFKNSANEKVFSGNSKYADLSIFSFHPVKHLTTGEGGLVTTSSEALAEKVKLLRSHGIIRDPKKMKEPSHGPWYYEMQELGYNYRIPDILCALGLSQLKRISANVERRREIANTYRKQLSSIPNLILPTTDANADHAYHLFVATTPRRNELFEHLRQKNIYAQIHYIPIHMQPYYRELYGKIHLPNSEKYYSQAISLPMFHALVPEEQDYVVKTIQEFFNV